MKKYKILLFPLINNESSYQLSLIDAFNGYFDVKIPRQYYFFQIVSNYFLIRPNYIHFDWFHMYYSHPNSRLKSSLKFLLFLIEISILNLLSVKIIVSLHNLKPHDSQFNTLDFLAYRFLIRRSNIVRFFNLYTSKVGARFFKIPSNKICVFYENCFLKGNSDIFDLKLDNSKINILLFGQIRPYKGVLNFLVQNKNYILSNFLKFNVYIVGNAYDLTYFNKIKLFVRENHLENVIINNVFIKNSQLDNLFKKFDFVLNTSSKNYNTGILAHCIRLNLPFITKNQYGVDERMDFNKKFLFNKLDSNSLDKILNTEYKGENLYFSNFKNTNDFAQFISGKI